MKQKNLKTLPTVSREEVRTHFPKTEAILLRLSVADKESIAGTAKTLHLTATEYLVKCHEIVAGKIPRT